MLDEIAKYSEINTNAHVSIAAAKMGKITNIYPSNYFKQEEIYRYSLINFENVNFTTKNELLKKREFQLMQKENLLTKLNDKNLTFNNAILNSLEFFKNNQNDIRCEVIRKLDHKVNCKKLIQNLQIIYPKDYGSFQSFNQINFDNLPDKFVLKPIWGHTNLGVFLLERNGEEFFDFHRKKSYTIEELEKEFSKEKQINSGSIMIEELLVDNCKNYKIPLDYKFYTFNGKLELIMQRCVNKGPQIHNWEFKFYDDNWNEISNPLNKSNINLIYPSPNYLPIYLK